MASVGVHQAEGLAARRRRMPTVPRRRGACPLAVVSGKGGVGKSALAVNLAMAAAGSGARTLLIDADAGLANADLLLGLVPDFDLDDWLGGHCQMSELICDGPQSLSLLVSGSSASSTRALREVLAGEGIQPLADLMASYEVVIVDLGSGISVPVVELAAACGHAWLVATPEPTSLADAYAMAKRLVEHSPKAALELVVNRFQEVESARRTHEALDRLCQRFLGRALPLRGAIPEDAALRQSVAMQTPVMLGSVKGDAGRRVEGLAESWVEEIRSKAQRT